MRSWLRRRGRRLVAVAAVLALLAGVVTWYAWDRSIDFRTEERMLTIRSGPSGTEPVTLDTTLYVPVTATGKTPRPAVLLGHGFGGTKDSVASSARELAGHGYVVLAWSSRGFGRSGGEIHLVSPDYEVRDAQRLVDWLAERPEVRRDGPGDPRVGALGASYGGALAMLLAAYDRRIDAIVPQVTWNDLGRALLPEASGRQPVDGVFKRAWAGLFFGAGGGLSLGAPAQGAPAPDTSSAERAQCGRFAADVCREYLAVATTGRGTPAAMALLRRSSPASVLDRVVAPTLLVQGMADSLFPLDEADANARGIAAHSTPVRVAWFSGGHDGGEGSPSDVDRVRFLTAQWLDHYLVGDGSAPKDSFTYSQVTGLDVQRQGLATSGFVVADYPGLSGNRAQRSVPVEGTPRQVANPPNGTPAALSSLPIAGAVSSFVNGIVVEVPGQHARFDSAPLDSAVTVVGSPTVRIRAASPTGEAVVFVKLYDVGPDGQATLPNGLVAPVRLTGLPRTLDSAVAQPVTVSLPAIVRRFEAGHRLRVTIATADQAYAGPPQPVVYTVGLADGDAAVVALPQVRAEPLASPASLLRWVLIGLLAVLLVAVVAAYLIARVRHRRRDRAVVDEHAGTPLVVRGLGKTYGDGFVAVSSVDFAVERGQVVGLLGPNGAGKTTTLRVLMGLIRPSVGEVLVFGHRLTAGAPVLSRVGALVEGPGFLPHLSGLDNLRLFWRATGRPDAHAHLDDVLAIAALGSAIHRKVRAYSHGMKQRLAIAQAMLGLPELLVLDEPTDGLDPPQIAEMRRVLRRYATDGRAVLVSSHLLAEVEQTCTHVVVMHQGVLVANGPVEDIVGDSPTVLLDVSDLDGAEAVLSGLAGVRGVSRDGTGLVVDLNSVPRAAMVRALVEAGVDVERVAPRRRLEDAFLALVGSEQT